MHNDMHTTSLYANIKEKFIMWDSIIILYLFVLDTWALTWIWDRYSLDPGGTEQIYL